MLHQFPVGDDVRTADIEGQAGGKRLKKAPDEVVEHILDGDGLTAGIDPPGTEHDRQALHQMPEHFEGCPAGADDVGSSEDRRLRPTRLEDCSHFLAA